MSQENLEIVNRLYDAFRRRDLDALVALHDAECEISPLISHVEGGTAYRGHAGVRTFWTEVHGAFEDWRPEPEQVRDFGQSLIVRLHFQGKGRDSGVTIDQHVWQALTLRNGRAAWWAIYSSEEEAFAALEAVGLRG